MDWSDYVDELVATHGSLAAVAERLAALRGYVDDVGSVERALRRLRGRGQLGGGTWGTRALAAFGLPTAADERLRWMGAYHSRFSDLPVPLCADLVRAWDRPPVSESAHAATWLALAHTTLALRSADREGAALHVKRARASAGVAPMEARIELALVSAFVDADESAAILASIATMFDAPMRKDDRACLHARWIDQRAYALNHERKHADAEALYRTIAEVEVPFVACRRANGLAYAIWKQGRVEEARDLARSAATHAGDGGHVRLRAMSLSMLAQIAEAAGDTTEATEAKRRADRIVARLEDDALKLRFAKKHG